MLDPRALAEDRERILASCKARGVDVDVDAAIAAQERWAAAMTRLNEANRQRAEHQARGKGGLRAAAREAHAAEGRTAWPGSSLDQGHPRRSHNLGVHHRRPRHLPWIPAHRSGPKERC